MFNTGKELNKTWHERVYGLTEEANKLKHNIEMKNTTIFWWYTGKESTAQERGCRRVKKSN